MNRDLPGPAGILYLVDGLGLSGKTKAMVDLIAGLDPRRYRAEVVCFDPEPSALYDRLHALGVNVNQVPCPEGLNLSVVARLTALVRRLRPDVLHCYNPRTMLYGGVVARALGVRATLGSLSAFACLTPDREYQFLPQKLFSASGRNRLRNRAAAWLIRALVTVSPSLGENFCRYNAIDLQRLRVVPYGVDVDRFAQVTPEQIATFRARYQLKPDQVVVASIGRLVEQKDYPTQLKAFALAAAQEPSLFMLLVGDGPLRGEIEELARQLGIADRVRLAGHSNEVPIAMRAVDVFVIASKFEPYGVALLEAKAAGVAIVATRVNEIPEILGERPAGGHVGAGTGSEASTGRLVPAENPAAMAEAFVQLARDAAERRALGARAALDARTRHSLAAAVRAYQQLYDEARGLAQREVALRVAF